jgi:hypothetical protein
VAPPDHQCQMTRSIDIRDLGERWSEVRGKTDVEVDGPPALGSGETPSAIGADVSRQAHPSSSAHRIQGRCNARSWSSHAQSPSTRLAMTSAIATPSRDAPPERLSLRRCSRKAAIERSAIRRFNVSGVIAFAQRTCGAAHPSTCSSSCRFANSVDRVSGGVEASFVPARNEELEDRKTKLEGRNLCRPSS